MGVDVFIGRAGEPMILVRVPLKDDFEFLLTQVHKTEHDVDKPFHINA